MLRLGSIALAGIAGLVLLGRPAMAAGGDDAAPGKASRGARVALVAPELVHLRGDRTATVVHHPLEGYDPLTYAARFGAEAERLLSAGPLRWEVVVAAPDADYYDAVRTDEPDEDPPRPLEALPAGVGEVDYVAVVRYAELAYDVREQPRWSHSGRMYILRTVQLALDLQLVLHDAAGEPLAVHDAQFSVEVPEIQAKAPRAKAYHRATVGALKRMRTRVWRGE